MNQNNSLQSPARQNPAHAANAFARTQVELENASSTTATDDAQENPFAQALARAGQASSLIPDASGLPDGAPQANDVPDWWQAQQTTDIETQQKEAKRQQELALLRKKLHDRVNPVDQTDVFDAREAQVKKQIEELRYELRLMATEVAEFHKEVTLTMDTTIVDPGQNGSYFLNFFHQLRQIIAMMRQHVHSARTWAQQAGAKAKKRPKRGGVLIQGSQSEQTTAVFDTMHHERSATYGGS